MLKFPDGSVFGFSTAIAAGVAASVISNANPAVATVTASIEEGTVLVIQSAASELNNRVAVAGEGTATTAPLLGIDTTDAEEFPTGTLASSLLAASDFIDFSQQGDLSSSGGDPTYWTGNFLEDKSGRQIQIPTGRNAKVMTLPLFYDRNLPWYPAAKKIDRKKEAVVLRVALPDGDMQYYYGYLSFDPDPTMTAKNPMTNTMTFSPLAESTLIEAAP